MARYILKRVLYMVLVMLIVTTLTFFLVHSIPGDPFSAMIQDLPEETRVLYMEKYGFDQPLIVQYVRFMKQLFSGDLGSSLRYPGRTVAEIAASFAPVSAQVGGIALAIGFVVGTILGIIAALNRNRFSDRTIMVLALLGTTIPTFVTASFLQYVFSVVWPIFPTTGWGTAKHMVLPVICLCVGPIATYARYMRSSVLDTTSQDYILTAEAKGAKTPRIVLLHIFRNSFLPCLTVLCTSVASIFSGSFIVESIFALPGLGTYFISAINDRDYSMILGLNIIFTGIYILSVLVTDILLGILDPRIRLAEKK
jgi:oligopeptide transport system permease protein